MFLSIIIPVYTMESYIASCLDSCLRQDISTQDYEIIVVNDGSLDMSHSIIEGYAERYGNIRVLSQTHKGPGGARNAGMRVAQGEYFMFLDADDRIQENSLKKLIEVLKNEHPDCLAFCAANMVGDKPVRRFSYEGLTTLSGIELLRRGVEPCATFTLWKSSFLKENDLWFEEGILHEDCEFTPRAYYYAKKVSFTNDIVYYVNQNPNSITRSVNPRKSFDLVNVVCKRLSEFVSEIDPEDRYIYHNLVALYLNNAMANILRSDKQQQSGLNKVMCESKDLWGNLIKSSKVKYKLEGYLFYCFPKHPLAVYSFMQRFNYRR